MNLDTAEQEGTGCLAVAAIAGSSTLRMAGRVSATADRSHATHVPYRRPRRPGPEAALEDAVTDGAVRFLFSLGEQAMWVGGSIPIGGGIPDIIVALWKPELVALRSARAEDAFLLAYLRRVGTARPETIVQRLRWKKLVLHRRLDYLSGIGVLLGEKGVFRISPIWRDILPETVAVEAKVSKWKQAVGQAARNRLFAHRNYVALPSGLAERVKHEPLFAQTGVGLIGISAAADARVVRPARRASPRLWAYYYILALKVAASLEKGSHDVYGTDR